MGRPSKFTDPNKQAVLEVLEVGGSRNDAAAIAQIGSTTLKRWLDKGKDAPEDSAFAEFYAKVLEAEAAPKVRALSIVYKALPDRPDLAWKFIERRVAGYAPPIAVPPPSVGTVNVTLSFFETDRSALGEVIEGEVVDEQFEPGADPAPAELAAGTSPKPA